MTEVLNVIVPGVQGPRGDSGYPYTFEASAYTSVTDDPGAGIIQFNNATLSSATEVVWSDSSNAAGNPDLSGLYANWNDGRLTVRNSANPDTIIAQCDIESITDRTTHYSATISAIALVGSLTDADACTLSHSDAGTAAGSIANNSITNAKLSDVNSSTIKGRATAGSGDPEDLTATQVRTIINVEDGATADQSNAEIETAYNAQVAQVSSGEKTAGTESAVRRFSPLDIADMAGTHGGGGGAVTSVNSQTGAVVLDADDIDDAATTHHFVTDGDKGDITIGSGATSFTIDNNAVTTAKVADEAITTAKLAHVTTDTFLGRDTAGTGDVEVMSAATARGVLNVEDNAAADQTDSEIETAYNNQVAQVSGGEITAGTETAIRRYSPADVKSFVDTHAGSGGAIEVEDEGVSLTTAVTKFNFVGSGVTVTEPVADEVTVTVASGGAPVDSVNGQTGVVVLDADDIDDAATTHHFVTDGDKGDITIATGATSFTIDNNAVVTAKIADEAVTLPKLAHIATDSFLGRDTAGTGDVEVLSVSTVEGLLNHDNLVGYEAGEHFLQAAITTVGTVTAGNVDAVVSAASETTAGKIEIATEAEINTGTDDTRAITPDAFAGSNPGIRYMQATVFDYTTNVSTGNGAAYIHIPPGMDAFDLIYVHAETITAGTGTGTDTMDIQIHNVDNALDMLSTALTVDEDETGSDTAATAAVINTSNDHVNTNDVLRIDVDAVTPTTPHQGLIITLGFRKP